MKFDPLFRQSVRLVGARLAVNAALFSFFVVDLAGFLGKLITDIIGVFFHMVTDLAYCRNRLGSRAKSVRSYSLLLPGNDVKTWYTLSS